MIDIQKESHSEVPNDRKISVPYMRLIKKLMYGVCSDDDLILRLLFRGVKGAVLTPELLVS